MIKLIDFLYSCCFPLPLFSALNASIVLISLMREKRKNETLRIGVSRYLWRQVFDT